MLIPNWLDILILVALCIGVAVGFSQGLLRQLMTMCCLYASIVISSQYYRVVSMYLVDWAPNADPAARNGVAMALIFLVCFAALNWLGYGIYPSTRFVRFQLPDQLSGAVLGGVWVGGAAAIGITIANYTMRGMFASWEPPRHAFELLLAQSQISAPLLSTLPLVYRFVSPWLPYGLPAPFLV